MLLRESSRFFQSSRRFIKLSQKGERGPDLRILCARGNLRERDIQPQFGHPKWKVEGQMKRADPDARCMIKTEYQVVRPQDAGTGRTPIFFSGHLWYYVPQWDDQMTQRNQSPTLK